MRSFSQNLPVDTQDLNKQGPQGFRSNSRFGMIRSEKTRAEINTFGIKITMKMWNNHTWDNNF